MERSSYTYVGRVKMQKNLSFNLVRKQKKRKLLPRVTNYLT